MQTLYSVESTAETAKGIDAKSILAQKIDHSRKLFSYLNFFICEVAHYAGKDAVQKAGKHLPSAKDLAVNTKISGNEVMATFMQDPGFQNFLKNDHPENIIDTELVRKIYQELVTTQEYNEYTAIATRDKKSEKRVLEFIFNSLMLPNENFIAHLEENFLNWDDDAELMQTLVTIMLNKPITGVFENMLSKEKDQFAHSLLHTTLEKKDFALELIKPRLKNWDADRIAALDMILLRMGVCEFLFFDTIPTKVTINEYIDLAKAYSTPQSGQFVNGLLDTIQKELQAENKIDKRVFKKSTL
ncbi:MAG TPA: transcription antitermination factor NusB [Chitinophagaceae bacterium]|jgi:N utilization substance protein B|nr:transcription antitermination factor NusB [Chitinophagaceae bacterium]